MFCRKCGQEINDDAIICPKCGCATGNQMTQQSVVVKSSTSSEQGRKISVSSLLGFILSLVSLLIALCGTVAITGMIFSIVGVCSCNKNNLRLKGLGIAGIVISAISLFYTLIVLIVVGSFVALV